eukprot:2405991-Rhodomonas_salina.1
MRASLVLPRVCRSPQLARQCVSRNASTRASNSLASLSHSWQCPAPAPSPRAPSPRRVLVSASHLSSLQPCLPSLGHGNTALLSHIETRDSGLGTRESVWSQRGRATRADPDGVVLEAGALFGEGEEFF